MDKKDLLKELQKINHDYSRDREVCHYLKDEALLKYIGDKDITAEFNRIENWYA